MKTVLCFFVIAAFIATGEALKCYDCAYDNPKCHDFDASDAGVIERTCPLLLTRCVKATVVLDNGDAATLRSCFAASGDQGRAAGETVKEKSTTYCSTDLCNGVSSTSAALTTLLVLIAPLIFRN